MNDDVTKAMESLKSEGGDAAAQSAPMEGRVWDRIEERRERRSRATRRWVAGALVLTLATGAALGAGAHREGGWIHHVLHHVHAHLRAFHDMVFHGEAEPPPPPPSLIGEIR